MKRFSPRLFALGLALGALGATAVLATNAYARTAGPTRRPIAAPRRAAEPGQPVIDWNRMLLDRSWTPRACSRRPIQPTRNMAIVHAAVYDAVDAIDEATTPT